MGNGIGIQNAIIDSSGKWEIEVWYIIPIRFLVRNGIVIQNGLECAEWEMKLWMLLMRTIDGLGWEMGLWSARPSPLPPYEDVMAFLTCLSTARHTITSQLKQTNQICHFLEPVLCTSDFNFHFLTINNVFIIKCRYLCVRLQIHKVCLSHVIFSEMWMYGMHISTMIHTQHFYSILYHNPIYHPMHNYSKPTISTSNYVNGIK